MRTRHRNPVRRNGRVVLVMTASIKTAIFEDRDFNCVSVNAASVAEPLPGIEILETTESLLITRVGNELFKLVNSVIGGDVLLTLSKKSFILSSELIVKTIPRL